MSSDSELPSPLPSPVFARCSPARGTVARKCRDFYLRRLERTAKMQKRWSFCEPAPDLEPEKTTERSPCDNVSHRNNCASSTKDCSEMGFSKDEGHPLRKCRSSLDIAMDSLRKEISSLIAQDNDLFRQLLSLHDSIAELRERQRSCYSLYLDDDDDEQEDIENDTAAEGDREDSHSPSLESLSDAGDPPETSPDSTLSSRSSLSANGSTYHRPPNRLRHPLNRHRQKTVDVAKKRYRASVATTNDSRPIVFVDKSEICFRCRKMAPPYRRSRSITSLYWLQEDMESYDSGIHLQGSHSDSDHEIFV